MIKKRGKKQHLKNYSYPFFPQINSTKSSDHNLPLMSTSVNLNRKTNKIHYSIQASQEHCRLKKRKNYAYSERKFSPPKNFTNDLKIALLKKCFKFSERNQLKSGVSPRKKLTSVKMPQKQSFQKLQADNQIAIIHRCYPEISYKIKASNKNKYHFKKHSLMNRKIFAENQAQDKCLNKYYEKEDIIPWQTKECEENSMICCLVSIS